MEAFKKILSGRFILTVASAFVFAYAVYADKLSAEATASILTAVFVSYFNRKPDEKI